MLKCATDKKIIFNSIKKFDRQTLIPLLFKHVNTESTIYSDM